MDHRTLEQLRSNHPAWRLLAASHGPILCAFLDRAFIAPNTRTLSQTELALKLEDFLVHVRQDLGEDAFPRRAAQYLDDWAADERGWLRKYYPAGAEEPHFDLTSAAEKALAWLARLEQSPFVGTESRLLTTVEMLRELVLQTSTEPEVRIEALEAEKARLEAEIAAIRSGNLSVLDGTRVKERFLQIADTARALLADFREVEQNFRTLDREVRARITTWDGAKGSLLDQIFAARDGITDSDQGKSFRAFWDFLMSPHRQDELTRLLEAVFALDPVKELAPDRRLMRIHFDWLDAGDVTQATVRRLSHQLRRYLDEKTWIENRRITAIIRAIELDALAVRDDPPVGPFASIDAPRPELGLVMDRPLYAPPMQAELDAGRADEGAEDIAAEALFTQEHVDKTRLSANIRRELSSRDQIALAELVQCHPLEQGLAELIAYLSLAADDPNALIDDGVPTELAWIDAEGIRRAATMPQVVFTRAPAVT
jgi:flagellar motility protein MotE (MotC chaperone)